MVKVIVARNKIDCSHLLGQFLDESHYDVLIEEDTDCYQKADCDPVTMSSCNFEACADCTQINTQHRITMHMFWNICTFRINS